MDLDTIISVVGFVTHILASIFFVMCTYYLYKNAKAENEVLENIKCQQKERTKRLKRFRDDFYDEG